MEIGYLSKLENPDTLRAIVQRLLFGLRHRWHEVVDNITETQNREISIVAISSLPKREQLLMPYLETFPAKLRTLKFFSRKKLGNPAIMVRMRIRSPL